MSRLQDLLRIPCKKNLSFLQLWEPFCRPGSPKSVPETPRVTKRAPRGFQKRPQNEPEIEEKQFSRNLDFERPYNVLAWLLVFAQEFKQILWKTTPAKHMLKKLPLESHLSKKYEKEGEHSTRSGVQISLFTDLATFWCLFSPQTVSVSLSGPFLVPF